MLSHLTLLFCMALGQADPVFDLKAILAPPLKARTLKTTEKDSIVTEEVMFHSELDGAKSVDIFAFFSYPKGAKNLPTFVWNQGGLYQASTYWTEFGARRGYATLCIDFPIPGYRSTGGYPINSSVELTDDPQKAPIYHGAVALLRAVSFLEARPEVDKDKIGMAGSSWGGFYTTLMIGLDPRLKVGSSMFGSGALELGNSWWDGQGPNPKRNAAFRQRWAMTLDPALRLAKSKTPIAWFTGTNDSFYWLPSVMSSNEAAAGPKHLSLLPNWNHALTPTLDEQVFAWLDTHLKGGDPFLKAGTLELGKDGQASWRIDGARPVKRASVFMSYGPAGNWVSRYWLETAAAFKDGECTATLPRCGLPGFAIGMVYDDRGFVTSTKMAALPAAAGMKTMPDYNGAAMWGDFDKPGQDFLRLHGLPLPKISESPQGFHAVLPKGKHTLGPIHFTAGVKHVFRAKLRVDQQTNVTIALVGTFDGKTLKEEKEVMVGPEAQDVISIAFTPPVSLAAGLRVLVVNPGTALQISGIWFEPMP